MINLIFCLQINGKGFFLLLRDQAYPNYQDNKFAISLQYLKKELS